MFGIIQGKVENMQFPGIYSKRNKPSCIVPSHKY